MSGIAGIYNFETRQVDPWQLTVLSQALAERGPDGGSELITARVAMVHRAFRTTAEARRERQPLISVWGHVLCWDGRLDNRDELLTLFAGECDRTDTGLVLAAYQKWGTDFLSRIIGDFALSLWDPSQQTLLLARDPFGVRPLYYCQNNDELIWSSTLTSLLALPDIEVEVNDEYVAGCFALYPELSSTPYRGINAVEPGQAMTIKDRQVQMRRFWRPAEADEIRYTSDGEYEEQFRQLFREAVACRLRSDRPIWSELSGGLDSSSVIFMADRIQVEEQRPALPVKTLSFVDNPSVTFFDHRFIEVVEKERGRPGVHLDGAGHWITLASPEERFIPVPITSVCVSDLHRRLWRSMKDAGARVLLSGLGGDQVTWSNLEPGPELGDLLFNRKPIELHRRLQVWSEATHQPYLELLWQEVLLPLLPTGLRARFQNQMVVSEWLDRDFVKRTNIEERLVLPTDPFAFKLPSRRIQSSRIWYIVMNIARGTHAEHAVYDKTYPFLHRPLVEFVMNVPIAQKLRPDETRSLMRRSLKNLLPERILNRRNKGTTGEALCRGLANEWPNIRPLLDDARLGHRGYVDVKALVQSLDRARHGVEFNLSSLMQALALEVWLRSLEHNVANRRSAIKLAAPISAPGWPTKVARAASAVQAGAPLPGSVLPHLAGEENLKKGGESDVFPRSRSC
jgi:asparagine synthase (glutamine-hydrolysing)